MPNFRKLRPDHRFTFRPKTGYIRKPFWVGGRRAFRHQSQIALRQIEGCSISVSNIHARCEYLERRIDKHLAFHGSHGDVSWD